VLDAAEIVDMTLGGATDRASRRAAEMEERLYEQFKVQENSRKR
jgi:hypothetical protein